MTGFTDHLHASVDCLVAIVSAVLENASCLGMKTGCNPQLFQDQLDH